MTETVTEDFPGSRGRGAEAGTGRSPYAVVSALGFGQILAWGSSYYLLAVLAPAIAADTGWSLAWVIGGLSIGLVASGLVSPRIGLAIDERGGRPVLALSSCLFAAGLAGLSLSTSLPLYVGSWLLMGLAMGAGLYDAVFSTLGRHYGGSARRLITWLTLFGGFVGIGTLSWPITAYLDASLGWRGACMTYASVHLLIGLPLHLLLMPRQAAPVSPEKIPSTTRAPRAPADRVLLILLAATVTFASAISGTISVHLLTILPAKGLTLTAAVGFGALVGPSQVAARIVEMAVGRRFPATITMLVSTILVALGLGAASMEQPVFAAALVLYGSGIGIMSIACGAVPLEVFGPNGYATLMGLIALPSLLAQAAAPPLLALFMEQRGADAGLNLIAVLALANALLCIVLARAARAKEPKLSRR
ncbi:MFS transporter [Aurantimonas sp. C2-6-R+9]|uniref:MFS transporter n=1 Tax=unclassified Aurantimonas TaxID=2638230 RepID=UPI002E196B1B|nr:MULTISPECIES: MFS transporter [unclassified Aurantimonas]MEC5292887.1 MFS transporter [Aurantimonas sp. C2-3-R2]MEC5383108.1 MFS transporter [Aurantimonas sp. C2-6-R+9]MEC5413937.1 MFS transporter [Aurantimonas sp. C2-4-R8]